MQIEKILITPTMAKELLEKNISNRRVKGKVVAKYATDMLNGLWLEDTGELITISKLGVLLNGQHRLLAIIKSNTSHKMHLATNAPDEVFRVIDTGSSRTTGDIFKIDNIPYSVQLPAIITVYKRLLLGHVGAVDLRYSSSIVLNYYYERPDFYKNVARKTKLWYDSISKILPPSIIGGFYCYFQGINESMAEDFFNQLCNAEGNISKPISLLKKKLTDDILSSKKLPVSLKNAYIVKAWNYFRNQESIKVLKFDFDTEKFPKAI
jgi:hypothetical protein